MRLKTLWLCVALLGSSVWLCHACAHPLGSPPGRLIDVAGTRLHLYCRGHGAPRVILDTGLGGVSLEWLPVVERVAHFAEVCVYDRAGYGWSDMGQFPRTTTHEVDELHALLINAGLRGPFILVGHSFGGYNAQLFARRYPPLTAGLVLIDASHPEQVERFQAPPYSVRTAPMSRFGSVQFGDMPPFHVSLSARARLQMLYQYQNWKPRRTMSYELLGFRDSERQVRAAPALSRMPLVVVTRGKRVWPADAHGDQLEQLWLDLQRGLAQQSPRSAHLVALNSGHQIHLEQPSVVAYAIALAHDAVTAPRATAVATLQHVDGRVSSVIWLKDSLDVDDARQVMALDDSRLQQ